MMSSSFSSVIGPLTGSTASCLVSANQTVGFNFKNSTQISMKLVALENTVNKPFSAPSDLILPIKCIACKNVLGSKVASIGPLKFPLMGDLCTKINFTILLNKYFY